nr:gpalpp motif-containing protein 1 [Quercus suber]
MSDIGPALPPHLIAKRKRQQEDKAANEFGTTAGAKRLQSPNGGEKRQRIIGPAMPPAPLDERPPGLPGAEESGGDDEDDFGPALPSKDAGDDDVEDDEEGATRPIAVAEPDQVKPQRDDWMTMPPKQDDLAARMDPTKIRARGFNTGKGAKGPNVSDEDNSAWNETPEQRRKRLQDEIMGVARPSAKGPQAASTNDKSNTAAAAKRIREHTEKTRGISLMEQHKGTKDIAAEEDDPSKRAFDREKDMGSGMAISRTQREQMLSKASDFSSKFSGGSYL